MSAAGLGLAAHVTDGGAAGANDVVAAALLREAFLASVAGPYHRLHHLSFDVGPHPRLRRLFDLLATQQECDSAPCTTCIN